MANIKITDLNAYTDPDSTDVLPIVDVTSDETKKVSIADLLENAGSGAEATPGIAFDGDSDTGIYRPGANQIAISTAGTKRLEISATGAVTIPGDLTVQGTTTFIDSTTLRVEDKNIELGYVGTPTDTTADGGGITLKGATDKTINWINATDAWTSSERFDFPAGTAAAPSVILNGDVNSGLYQPGADQVAISTGGTGRLFIDSSGRVGVGTASPAEKLQVGSGGSGAQWLRVFGSTSNIYIGQTNGNIFGFGNGNGQFVYATAAEPFGIGTSGTQPVVFGTNAVERVRIDSSGRLGVGTSSPSHALHVNSGTTNSVANFESTDAGAAINITDSVGSSSIETNSAQLKIGVDPSNSVSGSNLRLQVDGSTKLLINDSGNVGIGNTSPDDYLTIANTSTSGDIGLRFKGDASSRQFIMFGDPGGNQLGDIMYDHGTNAMRFRTNNNERVRIDSSGRLLVGTASASTADKLIVQGNASSSTGAAVLGLQVGTTTVSAGVDLGYLNYCDSSGNRGAWILGEGDGTWTSGSSHPTRLVFSTTASGASSPTERLRIDSSGRVGIGITPSAKLDVSSTSGTLFRCEDSGVAQLNIGNGGNSINYYDADTQIFRSGGGSERARIDSSGRLGVGTSSPGNTVHLAGPNGVGMRIENTSNSISAYSTLESSGALQANISGSGFFSWVTGGSEKVRIDSSGRLGVGTPTPQAELHLHDATGLSRLRFTGGAAGADNFEIGQAIVGYSNSGFSIYDVDEAATRFVIDSSGNVGIGALNPTFPLQVETTATGTTAGSNGVILVQSQASGRDAHIRFGDSVNSTARVGYLSNSLYAYVNGQERLRINSSGVLTAGNSNATTGQTIIDGWYNGDNKLNVFGSQHSSGGTVLAFAARPKGGGAGYVSSVGIASFARSAIELDGDGFKFKTGPSSTTAIGTDVTLFERARIDNSGNMQVSTGQFTVGTTASSGLQFISDGTFGTINSIPLVFRTAAQERARIDSSGRLGVGTSSPDRKLHVAGDWIRVDDGYGLDTSGGTEKVKLDNGYIALTTASLERIRIDSSGRLLVGTTSASGPALLDITGYSGNSAGQGILSLRRGSNASSGGNVLGEISFGDTLANTRASILAVADGTGGSGDLPTRLSFWTTPDGSATPAERMRIANTGETELYTNASFNLRTNRTSGLTAALNVYKGATSISTGTLVCQIRADGDLLNTNNSYGALSDVKLKENIVDANSQWDDLKAIQVRNYNFKEGQTHTQLGVVAQEVELVSPGLVRDTPDTDKDGNDLGTTTKSVNYSVLYMKAVKALQEAMDRIETLEAKVAALEGN